MKILIYLISLIFLGNIGMIIYNYMLIRNAEKNKSKYKEIIKTQKAQIEFLNKELEDMENEEIFGGGIIDM